MKVDFDNNGHQLSLRKGSNMIRELKKEEVISKVKQISQLYNDAYQLSSNTHIEPMLIQSYEQGLNPVTLIATSKDEIVGTLFGYDFKPKNWWAKQIEAYLPKDVDWYRKSFELTELIVNPNHQRKGIAKKLMCYLFENYDYDYTLLCVRSDNRHAMQLYEQFGFETFATNVILEYYDDIYFNLMALDLVK